jgi:hypothetical protein
MAATAILILTAQRFFQASTPIQSAVVAGVPTIAALPHHAQAASIDPDLRQQLLCVFNSPPGVDITLQVMTVTRQSTRHQRPVHALLKCPQQVQDVHPAGTRHFEDLDRRRVLQAKAARQIGGIVGAVRAAEGDDLRLEIRHGEPPQAPAAPLI